MAHVIRILVAMVVVPVNETIVLIIIITVRETERSSNCVPRLSVAVHFKLVGKHYRQNTTARCHTTVGGIRRGDEQKVDGADLFTI